MIRRAIAASASSPSRSTLVPRLQIAAHAGQAHHEETEQDAMACWRRQVPLLIGPRLLTHPDGGRRAGLVDGRDCREMWVSSKRRRRCVVRVRGPSNASLRRDAHRARGDAIGVEAAPASSRNALEEKWGGGCAGRKPREWRKREDTSHAIGLTRSLLPHLLVPSPAAHSLRRSSMLVPEAENADLAATYATPPARQGDGGALICGQGDREGSEELWR